jgi:hypothetical protein
MGVIKKIVLDVMKPLEPDILEMSKRLSRLGGVSEVDIKVNEMDREVENVRVTVSGNDIKVEKLRKIIEDLGGAIHSIDEATASKK